jgi:hypothetical protein
VHLFEFSAGRREGVTLGKVLKFVTGRETEPILGFPIQPSLTYDESLQLPHANTCICMLRMPLLTEHSNLELLDLAFANEFFGYA